MKPVWLIAAIAVAALIVRKRRSLEPTLVAGGLLAAVGMAVYSTGLVHLPNLDKVLEDVGTALGKWTYLLVAILAFAETGAFIGLLAPGETAIIVGGVVAGQGKIDLIALIAIVWASAVAGDITSFILGRRLGREFMVKHGPKVHLDEPKLEKVEAFFEKHGGKAIFLGRFVGLVRAVAPFIAGASRMPLRKFAPYDILGAGLWGTTFCVLGYVFWQSIDQVISIAKTGALALGSTIALVVGIVSAWRWLKVEENQRRLRTWADAQAQKPVIRPIVALLAPVVRRLRAPARFAYNRVTPGDLGLELTTLLAVAAVGSFVVAGYGIVLSDDRGLLTPGDVRGFRWSDSIRTDWLDELAKAVTHLGSLPVAGTLLVLVALGLLARRHVAEALGLLAGLAVIYIGVHLIKNGFDRPRPLDGIVATDGSSYVSGHAAYSTVYVAIAVALRHALPSLASTAAVLIVGIVLTVAVGMTRVYLHVHWFSDVAGGWGLGAFVFALSGVTVLLVRYFRHTSESQP